MICCSCQRGALTAKRGNVYLYAEHSEMLFWGKCEDILGEPRKEFQGKKT